MTDPKVKTLVSRGGTTQGKVRKSMRFNAFGKIETSSSYRGSGDAANTAMLRDLDRRNYK